MSSFLRVSYTLTWDPHEVADGNFVSKNHTYYFHGSGVSVIPDIAESLNLTLETYFGNIIESIDLVANGTADIGGLLISHDSIPEWKTNGMDLILTYLHPLDSETSNVYFRQPPVDSVIDTITRPFSKKLWIALMSLMLLISAFSRRRGPKSTFYTFWKTIIHTTELFIGRHNVHFRMTKVPTSIALTRLTASFFGIIICSVYIGKIASIFVMREDLVKSPKDLITYNYKLNTYSIIHINRVFENTNKSDITAKLIDFTKDVSFISNIIGKPNHDPRQALISHPDGFYSHALYSLKYSHELCSISVLKSTRKTARSLYIWKDSPMRESINLRIVQLLERGINHRHQVNFKRRFFYSCLQQRTQFNQLTYKYVEMGFVPLFIGFALAIFLDLTQRVIQCAKNGSREESKTKKISC